jgi:hypothetical protein
MLRSIKPPISIICPLEKLYSTYQDLQHCGSLSKEEQEVFCKTHGITEKQYLWLYSQISTLFLNEKPTQE